MGRERNVTDVSDGTVLNTFHYTRTYLDGGILGGREAILAVCGDMVK